MTDTDKDLSLTFRAGGTYTISLRAIADGGTDSYSRTITVANPPKATAAFTYSPNQNLVVPAKITFTNTSSNADSYKWDFGDGTTSITTTRPKTSLKPESTR